MTKHSRLAMQPKSRLLVVDDEEFVRKFVSRVLGDAGYDVTVAADGADALQIAERNGPFDLCVVDLMMPGMPGDEVARLLRRAEPDVKILYVTGHVDRLFNLTKTLSANEAFLDK